MKSFICASLLVSAMATTSRAEQLKNPPHVPPTQDPPPVYQADVQQPPVAVQPPAEVYVYDQKPLPEMPVLITPDQAQTIVDQFKTNYGKLGSPRVVIYVNRELVDEQSGLKLTGPSPVANNVPPAPTLPERQMMRDVERLMGRPLRAAGVTLVDQHAAAQLTAGRSIDPATAESEQARKDRDALSKIADVAVEVLTTMRDVPVRELSGEKTYALPDIQVTAIRLKDGKIIGQASASELVSRSGGPELAARTFGPDAVTEATALALMQDIMQEAK